MTGYRPTQPRPGPMGCGRYWPGPPEAGAPAKRPLWDL